MRLETGVSLLEAIKVSHRPTEEPIAEIMQSLVDTISEGKIFCGTGKTREMFSGTYTSLAFAAEEVNFATGINAEPNG